MLMPKHIPPAGDEQPLELLYACHEKVRHFSALAGKISAHVATHGADQEAREAAVNVMRYFEIAAPLHHADEEEDVFPALRQLCDTRLTRAIDQVSSEHLMLERLWQSVCGWLKLIAEGTTPAYSPGSLPQFVTAYPEHAAREEREIFPALARLSAAEIDRIARRMRERRGAPQ